MATKTTNYELTKPEQTDFYNVDDFNNNMDIIDEEIKKAAETATSLSYTVIPENADLNNYLTPGRFIQSEATEASTLINNPLASASTGIVLDVVGTNNEKVVFQILYGIKEGSIYKRRSHWGSWNDWIRIATYDEVNSKVNKTGDTMTGLLTADGGIKLPARALAYDKQNISFGDNAVIGAASNGLIGLYSKNKVSIRVADTLEQATDGVEFSNESVIPTKNNHMSLGTSANKWKEINATTFNGNLTGTANIAKYVHVNDIAKNTDLNTVTAYGFHRCSTYATAQTLINSPASTAFFMIVGCGAYTYQEIITYKRIPERYMRIDIGDGTWGDWVEVSLKGHTHDASELSTGTISADRLPDNFSYLKSYKTLSNNSTNSRYIKLFTIESNNTTYKDFNYTFDVVRRGKCRATINITLMSENNGYLTGIVPTYEGNSLLGSYFKFYYYADTTNGKGKVDVWMKANSWDYIELFPKTLYNKELGLVLTYHSSLAWTDALPTDFTTEIPITAAEWSGNAATATELKAGMLGGQITANTTAVAALDVYQVRDIAAHTSDLTAGVTTLATGKIRLVYE